MFCTVELAELYIWLGRILGQKCDLPTFSVSITLPGSYTEQSPFIDLDEEIQGPDLSFSKSYSGFFVA